MKQKITLLHSHVSAVSGVAGGKWACFTPAKHCEERYRGHEG